MPFGRIAAAVLSLMDLETDHEEGQVLEIVQVATTKKHELQSALCTTR